MTTEASSCMITPEPLETAAGGCRVEVVRQIKPR